MIFNFKIFNTISYKLKASQLNRGMTYVEIIVVLGIFGIMSSIIIFNYPKFQAKIDIKNLASDIALQIVEAQKSSLSGKLPPRDLSLVPNPTTWKPSYGVYFDITGDNKSFIYFTDLNRDGKLLITTCDATSTSECLEKFTIVKGNNSISKIDICSDVDCISPIPVDLTTYLVHITFKRTDYGPTFTFTGAGSPTVSGAQYIQITVQSPNNTANARIKIYPSGRVEVR